MTELLPCPFCGGENVETSYKDTFSGDFRRGVYCADCCGGIYPYYDTEAEAIAAWNTRHVDTCKFVPDGMMNSKLWLACSACNGYVSVDYDPPRYCPHCGKLVVS